MRVPKMLRIISALILAVTTACAVAADAVQLVDNPPDRHVVVKGDTLWGIAGKFLKEPWRWPEIWQINKAEIKNPHRIYPGDIVVLDLSGGNPRLRIARPVKVQPLVYSEDSRQAIPSIPPHVIEPFISEPLVVEPDALDSAPRIVATQEDRVFVGNGDTAFVSSITGVDKVNWQMYRPVKPLKDPDTQEILGYEAFFLGDAKLIQPGEPAVIRIQQAKEEVGRGDRLIAATPPTLASYIPHRPEQQLDGKILSIYAGVREAGPLSVIAINRGAREGLEVGHVIALYRKRVSQGYDDNNRRINTPIPDERYGLAFVFRTFERIAYALVMESGKPVIVGDAIRNP